jgi:hypothetical protein
MEEGQHGGETYLILTDAHIHSSPQSTCFLHILPNNLLSLLVHLPLSPVPPVLLPR